MVINFGQSINPSVYFKTQSVLTVLYYIISHEKQLKNENRILIRKTELIDIFIL